MIPEARPTECFACITLPGETWAVPDRRRLSSVKMDSGWPSLIGQMINGTALGSSMPFGALLDTAQREPVTVSKQGRLVAVMMSIHDYEEMKLSRLRAHLAKGEAQIERGESTTIRNKQESHEFFESIKKREKISNRRLWRPGRPIRKPDSI